MHSKLSSILFPNMVITDLDKTKNIIDVVKEEKETIAFVFPCKDLKRPGVIHLTSRTKGIKKKKKKKGKARVLRVFACAV